MIDLERLLLLSKQERDVDLFDELVREVDRRGADLEIDEDMAWALINAGHELGSTKLPDVLLRAVIDEVRFDGYLDATLGDITYVPIGVLLLHGLHLRDEPYGAPGFMDFKRESFDVDDVWEAFQDAIGFDEGAYDAERVELNLRADELVGDGEMLMFTFDGWSPFGAYLLSVEGNVIDDMLHGLRALYGSPPVEAVLYDTLIHDPDDEPGQWTRSERHHQAFNVYTQNRQTSDWYSIQDLLIGWGLPPHHADLALLRNIILNTPR